MEGQPHIPGSWGWKVRKSEVQAQIELYRKFEIGETLSRTTKITFKAGTLGGQYLGKD